MQIENNYKRHKWITKNKWEIVCSPWSEIEAVMSDYATHNINIKFVFNHYTLS